jgi:hypothetical protein
LTHCRRVTPFAFGLGIINRPSVSTLAGYVALPVRQAYYDLIGRRIKLEDQVPADMRTVVTDRVVREVPAPMDMLILWEDKSVAAFERHALNLQRRLREEGQFSLAGKTQQIWEDEEAILAKVRFHFSYILSLSLYLQTAYLACDGPRVSPKMGDRVWRSAIFRCSYRLRQRFDQSNSPCPLLLTRR